MSQKRLIFTNFTGFTNHTRPLRVWRILIMNTRKCPQKSHLSIVGISSCGSDVGLVISTMCLSSAMRHPQIINLKTQVEEISGQIQSCSVIKMSASGNIHRIQKELSELNSTSGILRNVEIKDSDLSIWTGLLFPINAPYNKGAFRVQMIFPSDYPFKPPTVQFLTRIYHPNVDESGAVCLNIVNPEFWKPTTRVTAIVEALARLIEKPEPNHPLRTDLAQLLTSNHKQFMKNAEEFTRKYSEKRTTAHNYW